jgi:hypothetical protein
MFRMPTSMICNHEFYQRSWHGAPTPDDKNENISSADDINTETVTENHLFNDIDNFIQEHITIERDERRIKTQIDLDCDDVLKSLTLCQFN